MGLSAYLAFKCTMLSCTDPKGQLPSPLQVHAFKKAITCLSNVLAHMMIAPQEALDIDVLVHGEAERTDMVEFFGEKLEGFAFTANAWVQVRPAYSRLPTD